MDNDLAALRAERGWSQAHVATLLGVSRQTVISIERGRFDPSLPLAFRLAHVFDCRIEDLFRPDPDDVSPARG
ncbi:helix-turn-helix transcriptional regulator [Georgenia halophila]|uniref:Helix-turn-helix transcriptional regulator n=1 Tax=Georgenia halophila TaxID=620889 RepID=A0ABP8KXL2_9MICO